MSSYWDRNMNNIANIAILLSHYSTQIQTYGVQIPFGAPAVWLKLLTSWSIIPAMVGR